LRSDRLRPWAAGLEIANGYLYGGREEGDGGGLVIGDLWILMDRFGGLEVRRLGYQGAMDRVWGCVLERDRVGRNGVGVGCDVSLGV